ncbi:helix-turn-helix domain-containing protein [Halegenticoccus soli]|uniref:helix-turn-helix domain-containing protein n=1 Tax=Halegenticoccus soli TaxID=1985678 RepID=UPI000C6EF066|nr:helix-turn-helix domain-containing protein [Halegenticoccus soli]
MILAEFYADQPILRETIERVPGTRISWEQSDALDEGRVRVLVWVESGDFGAFDAALAADPTVASPRHVMDFGERRLYRLDLIDEGLRTSLYPLITEEGGLIRELASSSEGWRFRVAFPDRRTLTRVHRFCVERGVDFDLRRLCIETPETEPAAYGLSPKQRDVLLAAFEAGYFEVPRRVTLSELAGEFRVSSQALSERLRQGVNALIEQTIARPDETVSEE